MEMFVMVYGMKYEFVAIGHAMFSANARDKGACYIFIPRVIVRAWWRHQMEKFSALLALVREIHRSRVPRKEASDAELWGFLWSAPE